MDKRTKNGSPASRRAGRSLHLRLRQIAVILVAVLLLFLLYRGNTNVRLTEYVLPMKYLPAAFDGFTIAHLSDLHNARFGAGQQRLLASVRETRADIIVITGDTIDSRHADVPLAVETLRLLSQIAPVYLVTGNHEARVPRDCDAMLQEAEAIGVVALRNAAVPIRRNGVQMQLIGLHDLDFYVKTYGHGGGATRLREQLARMVAVEEPTILLSHRPELYAWYAEAGADLVLCGHAHGGQIRLPWIGGLVAPGQGLLPKYTEGVHTFGNTAMVISRGLGNSVIPLRVNNPPEVVSVTLRCGEGRETEDER